MTKRESRSARVDPDKWSKFVDWVVEKEGQKHGEIGRHVENALMEYIDHGRGSRIERKVDTILETLNSAQPYTHTQGTDTVEKARNVYKRIRENHGGTVKDDDVTRAVEDIAGADPRTVEKYKDILKRRELLFEHPSDSPVWTTQLDTWVQWVEGHIDNNPSITVHDVTKEYPLTVNEYAEHAEAVADASSTD